MKFGPERRRFFFSILFFFANPTKTSTPRATSGSDHHPPPTHTHPPLPSPALLASITGCMHAPSGRPLLVSGDGCLQAHWGAENWGRGGDGGGRWLKPLPDVRAGAWRAGRLRRQARYIIMRGVKFGEVSWWETISPSAVVVCT